jgi:hypothetical protein
MDNYHIIYDKIFNTSILKILVTNSGKEYRCLISKNELKYNINKFIVDEYNIYWYNVSYIPVSSDNRIIVYINKYGNYRLYFSKDNVYEDVKFVI